MADSFILFLSIIEKSLNGNEGRAAVNKPRTKTQNRAERGIFNCLLTTVIVSFPHWRLLMLLYIFLDRRTRFLHKKE